MTDANTMRDSPGATPWTCPFCPLMCDGLSVQAAGDRWEVSGSDCPKVRAALAHFGPQPSAATPLLDGQPATLEAALDAAAAILAASRQPLFGGLATDVAGARALYRVAARCGAIADPAGGDALMHGLRSLQDRGQFTTTLAEVRNRADVIVCIGGSPTPRLPEFFRRCGLGDPLVPARHVVGLGAAVEDGLTAWDGVSVETLGAGEDPYALVAALAALVAERVLPAASPALVALAERLRGAHYGVIVWEPSEAGAGGSLMAEAVQRLVNALNRHTRAGALPLGGGPSAATVNQVWAWLSGLPLRSRAGPEGLQHEPLAWGTDRLLADGAVDSLLWVASFGPELRVPSTALPTVVIGHPALPVPAGTRVYIPVATPGIGRAGHLFRTDGVVLMPLQALRDDPLPGVDAVASALAQRLEGMMKAAA